MDIRRIAIRLAASPRISRYVRRYKTGEEVVDPPGSEVYKEFFARFGIDLVLVSIDLDIITEEDKAEFAARYGGPDTIVIVETRGTSLDFSPQWLAHDFIGHAVLDRLATDKRWHARARLAMMEDYELDVFNGDKCLDFLYSQISTFDPLPSNRTKYAVNFDKYDDYFQDLGTVFVMLDGQKPAHIALKDQGNSLPTKYFPESRMRKRQGSQLPDFEPKPGMPACTQFINEMVGEAFEAIPQELERRKGHVIATFND